MDPFHQEMISPILQGIEDGGIQSVKAHMKKLYDIWQEFGIDDDRMSMRSKVVWSHVQNLLKDIFEEENSFYKTVQKRIQTYTTAIEGLSEILLVSAKVIEGPLIKRDEMLRQELERLTKMKRERLKVYGQLKSEDSEYRRIMHMEQLEQTLSTKVPSDEDIRLLKQQVGWLRLERERRCKKFKIAKQELTTILETTEWVPETPFEKEILSEKEGFSLSEETLELLERVVGKARRKREELERRRKELLEKLQRLWNTLKVEEFDQVEFLTTHEDCRLLTLESIESEVKKLEKIRKQKMQSLVKELKHDLEELWDKCHVSESERRLFKMYSVSELTGEVLEPHEEEVEKWRQYYKDVKHVLEKIKKRQQLWDKLITFENNATNPDRLKNRGGKLLLEEKERKNLQKELPSLENDIFKDIEVYESRSNIPFLYYGEDYRTFVSNQWMQRLNQKEYKKMERKKQRSLESTTASTPSKRSLVTPRTTPRKVVKSNGSSIYHTPLVNRMYNTVKAPIIGRLFSPKSAQKKDCKPQPSESFNGTTYTDFVDNLNCLDKTNFHSSVIEKTSINSKILKGNKIKKGGIRPLRRSSRNSSKTIVRVTPARGKLGLPFLI